MPSASGEERLAPAVDDFVPDEPFRAVPLPSAAPASVSSPSRRLVLVGQHTPLVFMTCMFQPSIPTAITKKVMPSMRTILKKINEQNRKKYVKTAIVLSPLLKIRERQFLPALPLDL